VIISLHAAHDHNLDMIMLGMAIYFYKESEVEIQPVAYRKFPENQNLLAL
jgi:hypothetical protein